MKQYVIFLGMPLVTQENHQQIQPPWLKKLFTHRWLTWYLFLLRQCFAFLIIYEIFEKGNSKGTKGYVESIGGRKHSLLHITAVLLGGYSYMKDDGEFLKVFNRSMKIILSKVDEELSGTLMLFYNFFNWFFYEKGKGIFLGHVLGCWTFIGGLRIGHSEFPCASVSERVQVWNLSYENEFCTHFHFRANQSHFHKNDFALRLALKQRHRGT